jgi:hypothetical protein
MAHPLQNTHDGSSHSVVNSRRVGTGADTMNRSISDEAVIHLSPAHHQSDADASKKPWISPGVIQLPRLSELTLQSPGGIPGGGGTGGGGSTVIP